MSLFYRSENKNLVYRFGNRFLYAIWCRFRLIVQSLEKQFNRKNRFRLHVLSFRWSEEPESWILMVIHSFGSCIPPSGFFLFGNLIADTPYAVNAIENYPAERLPVPSFIASSINVFLYDWSTCWEKIACLVAFTVQSGTHENRWHFVAAPELPRGKRNWKIILLYVAACEMLKLWFFRFQFFCENWFVDILLRCWKFVGRSLKNWPIYRLWQFFWICHKNSCIAWISSRIILRKLEY